MEIILFFVAAVCFCFAMYTAFKTKQSNGRYKMNKIATRLGEGSFKEGLKHGSLTWGWGILTFTLFAIAVNAYQAIAKL